MNRPGRNRRIYLQDAGCTDDAGDRGRLLHEVEAELVIERGVDRVVRADQEQRVAVRRRSDHRLGGVRCCWNRSGGYQ
jgi:hypothetical protein